MTKCKHCGHEIEEKKTIKMPEFNIEITEIQDWSKPYNEIIAPKGFRKIEVWELWRILDSKYRDKVLGEYKEKSNYFWCEQTEYDKRNNYSRWLYLSRGLNLGSNNDVLAVSYSGGRVIFCRSLK